MGEPVIPNGRCRLPMITKGETAPAQRRIRAASVRRDAPALTAFAQVTVVSSLHPVVPRDALRPQDGGGGVPLARSAGDELGHADYRPGKCRLTDPNTRRWSAPSALGGPGRVQRRVRPRLADQLSVRPPLYHPA